MLPRLYQRFGIARVTQAGAVLTALGLAGWAFAAQPWQLFAITPISAAGWALTSGAAMTAMVAPWFAQRRPSALAWAYNGNSLAGIVFCPLWVFLIARFGFPMAAILIGAADVVVVLWLSSRYLTPTPADLGLLVDDGITVPAVETPPPGLPLVHHHPWSDPRLITQAVAFALVMSAQMGLLVQLFSLLVPAMGVQAAGTVMSLMTVCTLVGRAGPPLLMRPGTNRRIATVVNNGVQAVGSVVLLLSGGASVPLLIVGSLLFGLGSGNLPSLPALIAQSEFPEADVQRVVGLVFSFSQFRFALAPMAFGALQTQAAAASIGAASIVFMAALVLQLGSMGALLAGMRRSMPAAAENPL
jgi:MFS family permease